MTCYDSDLGAAVPDSLVLLLGGHHFRSHVVDFFFSGPSRGCKCRDSAEVFKGTNTRSEFIAAGGPLVGKFRAPLLSAFFPFTPEVEDKYARVVLLSSLLSLNLLPSPVSVSPSSFSWFLYHLPLHPSNNY